MGTGSVNTSSVYARHSIGVYSPTSTTQGLDYNTNNTQTTIRGFGQCPTGNDLANAFGATVLDIYDYASTSKLKTIRSMTGVSDNNNGLCSNFYFTSGYYGSSSAVDQVNIYLNAAGNLAVYSHFALYGIK